VRLCSPQALVMCVCAIYRPVRLVSALPQHCVSSQPTGLFIGYTLRLTGANGGLHCYTLSATPTTQEVENIIALITLDAPHPLLGFDPIDQDASDVSLYL
jgi:hypothetical protein